MAVGQNKRRIERLERRIVILEDELGLDHSDVLEAEDDAEIVTDGGQDVDHHSEGSCPAAESCGFVADIDLRTQSCETWDPTGEVICTRPEGHDGDHVACTQDNHGLARWTDDDLEDVQEDVDAARETGEPATRLREALKQLTIARRQAAWDDVVHPSLDEAEVLIRGAADRLEGQGFPGVLEPSDIVDGADDGDVQEAIDQAQPESP